MSRQSRLVFAAAVLVLGLVQTGCPKKEEAPAPQPPATTTAEPPTAAPAPMPRVAAMAKIAGPAGSPVSGLVTFVDTGNGLAIEAHVSGLAPGRHGFHIHEVGDCGGDFSAAGAHFNPGGHPHAGPDATACHNGDLGNLLAAADGNAMITMTSRHITLDAGPTGILGRSVIVHESEDDLTTQPTGNSGARIGCGVIESAPGTEPAAATQDAAVPAGASGGGASN